MKQTITFTDIIEQLDENILNVQFDLEQDWKRKGINVHSVAAINNC